MIHEPLLAWLRSLASPALRRMAVWALVLALSLLSFYVHLLRASVDRAEAAFAEQDARWPVARAMPRVPAWR